MIRYLLTALIFAASAAASQDFDISASLANDGLTATEARLDADGGSTDTAQFALGAVRFLRGIEATLQRRHRHGAVLEAFGIPVLRLPVPPNPDPEPFDPALVAGLFEDVLAEMAAAREALEPLDEAAEVALAVDLAGIWFDIDGDGVRDSGEGLFVVAGAALAGPAGAMPDVPDSLVVRFDTADAAWLRAYTHLLSAVGELVLAFDPTTMVAEIASSTAEMHALRGTRPPDRPSFLRNEEALVDMIAIVYGAINRVPDVARTRAARDHLLAMVAENRAFWSQVAREADNEAEWIPNATQVSALGIELPPDTATAWLRVLADAEAVLKGELLVGHWRVEPGAGVNVAKLLENPIAVDLVTWVHGHGLVPYFERGPLADAESLRQFERMFAGDALLFMLWLN